MWNNTNGRSLPYIYDIYTTMKKKLSSTPAMYALVAAITLAIAISCSVVHCSEFQQAAHHGTHARTYD